MSPSSSIGLLFTDSLAPEWISPVIAFDCELPSGAPVALVDYREELTRRRIESVESPGLYLDRSRTGAGKSFADREAIKLAPRSLVVSSTHEQCGEICEELKADGIDAVAFPRRATNGDGQNCWNNEADAAESAGLMVGGTVCPTCPFRDQCLSSGYLAQVEKAKHADVAVATHKRVEMTGLHQVSSKWSFVSIHEDATDTLFPKMTVSREQLAHAYDVSGYLLKNPKWLDHLGERLRRDPDGNLIPDAKLKERREALKYFLRILDNTIAQLIETIDEARTTAEFAEWSFAVKPQGLEWLLWRAVNELNLREEIPWDAIISITSGDYWNFGVLVDDSPVPQPKSLIVTRHNLPARTATCWLADATADRSLLETAAGVELIDGTPDGHLELRRSVTQIEVDIKRSTSPEQVTSTLRGILHQTDARQIGVITHRPLVEAIQKLGEPFEKRIVRVAYFGSGQDRASNTWYVECDLIVVLGTPRIPTSAVRERLFQLGMTKEAAEEGDWSKHDWRGWTDDRVPRLVRGSGYRHPDWQRVHRTLVRANLIQAAGRGRGVMADGCTVLILSNEECGFPLHEQATVQQIPSAPMSVFIALQKELERVYPLERLEVTTKEVARKASLSESQTRKQLNWLEESGLIRRKGQRGGWWIPAESSWHPRNTQC